MSSRQRRRWVRTVSVLVPVALAFAALWSLQPTSVDATTGQPNLTAALVNNDQIVTTEQNGQQVPVAAGRILVGELVTSDSDGFDWQISNSATAAADLRSGAVAAVVTIPANFTQSYLSAGSQNPVQAVVDVQTDGSHSYLASILARSLARTLTAQLSEAFTQQFIDQLLMGYSTLGQQLGEAATGAQELASGLHSMASLAAALPDATSALATGAQDLSTGSKALTDGLRVLQSTSQGVLDGTAELARLNAELRTLISTGTQQQQLDKLAEIDALTALLELGAGVNDVGVDLAADTSAALTSGAQLLASGSSELSDGMPALVAGLSGAASGSSAIASGLNAAASALPKYTTGQAADVAMVAANPVSTQVSTDPTLPSARSAIGAVLMPIALWLGALALCLTLVPVQARALTSRASSLRIVAGAALPMIGWASLQAALVMLGALSLGLTPVHHLGLLALIWVSAVAFGLLHQGIAALAPRAAWLISLGLLSVQVVCAGVILPLSFSPALVQTLGEVLPLSIAMRGAQSLISGGTIGSVDALLGVGVSGLIGVIFLGIAVARGRVLRPVARSRDPRA